MYTFGSECIHRDADVSAIIFQNGWDLLLQQKHAPANKAGKKPKRPNAPQQKKLPILKNIGQKPNAR